MHPVFGRRKPCSTFRAIAALPLILGDHRKDDASYLDTCRIKRNTAEYDMAGVATHEDATELVSFVKELQLEVRQWLQLNHPTFVP